MILLYMHVFPKSMKLNGAWAVTVAKNEDFIGYNVKIII